MISAMITPFARGTSNLLRLVVVPRAASPSSGDQSGVRIQCVVIGAMPKTRCRIRWRSSGSPPATGTSRRHCRAAVNTAAASTSRNSLTRSATASATTSSCQSAVETSDRFIRWMDTNLVIDAFPTETLKRDGIIWGNPQGGASPLGCGLESPHRFSGGGNVSYRVHRWRGSAVDLSVLPVGRVFPVVHLVFVGRAEGRSLWGGLHFFYRLDGNADCFDR
jgi:hypothetical protein